MILDDLASDKASDPRFNQIVAGADALLSAPSTPALHPGGMNDPASVLTPSALGPAAEDGNATSQADAASALSALANQAVLQTHASLESTADANGLVGTVHGVTNLGEAAGLGHIGGSNLVTDGLTAPAALASGDPSTLGHVVPDATSVDEAANQLLSGAATDAGANPGLVAPAVGIVPATQLASATPAETLANSGVIAFHDTIEGASDVGGLSGSVHGVTNLGETIGLGHLGAGDNLLTDAADTPSDLLAGNISTLGDLPTNAVNVAGAAGGLASGVESDVASGAFLANPVGNAVNMAQALSTFPTASLANEAIDTVHASLEAGADPSAPGTIHGVIGLGNAVGLGEIGGANALTDATDAPGALLAGNTTPLTNVPGDVGTIGSAASAALTGAGGDLAQNGLVEAATHSMTGSGLLAGDLPGQGIVDGVTSPAIDAIDAGGATTGAGSIAQAATATLGTASGGLVDSVAHVPGDVVAGTSDGVAPLPGDAGASLAATTDTIAHDSGSLGIGGELTPVAAAGAVAGGIVSELEPVATSGAESVSHDIVSAGDGLSSSAVSDVGGTASDLVSGVAATAATATHDGAGAADTLVPSAATDAGATAADVATTAASAADTLAHAGASTGAASALSSTAAAVASDTSTAPAAIVSASTSATNTAAHLVPDATNALPSAGSASAGSHDVATVSVGPQSAAGGTSLDVLNSNGDGTQLIGSHAGTVGAPTPTVASVSLLPDTLHFAAASGGGDALSGALSSVASSATPATVAHTGIDLTAVHVDVPVAAAHADPLATLAHAVHHG